MAQVYSPFFEATNDHSQQLLSYNEFLEDIRHHYSTLTSLLDWVALKKRGSKGWPVEASESGYCSI